MQESMDFGQRYAYSQQLQRSRAKLAKYTVGGALDCEGMIDTNDIPQLNILVIGAPSAEKKYFFSLLNYSMNDTKTSLDFFQEDTETPGISLTTPFGEGWMEGFHILNVHGLTEVNANVTEQLKNVITGQLKLFEQSVPGVSYDCSITEELRYHIHSVIIVMEEKTLKKKQFVQKLRPFVDFCAKRGMQMVFCAMLSEKDYSFYTDESRFTTPNGLYYIKVSDGLPNSNALMGDSVIMLNVMLDILDEAILFGEQYLKYVKMNPNACRGMQVLQEPRTPPGESQRQLTNDDPNRFEVLPEVETHAFKRKLAKILKAKTEKITGLVNIKGQLEKFAKSALIAKMKELTSGKKQTMKRPVMVFMGNPGTGKTMIAQIVCDLMEACGITTTNKLIAVQREDLVAEYVGNTAVKTKKMVQRAFGGTLFVDECYRLTCTTNDDNESRDYGPEALETLMRFIEGGDVSETERPAFIFAGYIDKMEKFESVNPGLKRRLTHKFFFDDYTTWELVDIFFNNCQQEGYSVECDKQNLRSIFDSHFSGTLLEEHNAGLCNKLFERAKEIAVNRLISNEILYDDDQEIQWDTTELLTEDDIEVAAKAINDECTQ